MGASQSSNGGAGTAPSIGRPKADNGVDVQDYYGLLELPDPTTATSSSDEIRKAYRRLALRYHPDKNRENIEAANKHFTLLQAAYEVLSDDQERAWYDAHREQILNGYGDEDAEGDGEEMFDEEAFQNFRTGKQKPPPAPTGSSAPGLTPRQIMRFLDASLCMDVKPPSADETGFYGTFRRIFERLADEERGAAPYPGEALSAFEPMPGFGYSHTPYVHPRGKANEDVPLHQVPVRDFYAVWAGFATRKGFGWRDKYRLHDAPDRRVKRAMEKENKRNRDTARREYNDTVRSLISFIRKRDPRVKAHIAAQSSNVISAEDKERLRQAAEREKQEQEERARAFRQQSWDAWEHGDAGTSESEISEGSFGEDAAAYGKDGIEDGSDVDGDEFDEGASFDDEGLVCYACDKAFQSAAAFANHERSNKHRKQVQKLKRDMMREDRELRKGMAAVAVDAGSDEDGAGVDSKVEGYGEQETISDLDPTAGLSKKARQRLKKRLKEQDKTDSSKAGTARNSDEEEEIAGAGTLGTEAASSEHEEAQTPSLTNEKKPRRAKKADDDRSTKSNGSKAKQRCNVCRAPFDSRSKLFSHIRQSGHAQASS